MAEQGWETKPLSERLSAVASRLGNIDRGWLAVLLGLLIVGVQLAIQLLG